MHEKYLKPIINAVIKQYVWFTKEESTKKDSVVPMSQSREPAFFEVR